MAIATDIKKLTEDIAAALETRKKDIDSMAADTRKMLSDSEGSRIKDFKSLKKEIDADVRRIEADVNVMRSEAGAMLDSLHKESKAREKVIAGFLGEVKADMKEAANAWSRMHAQTFSHGKTAKSKSGFGRRHKAASAIAEGE